jgi:excisionase family DNA binding protein
MNKYVDQLLTMAQIAEYLNVSKRTVQRLRHDGELPQPISVRGSLRWDRETIEAWAMLLRSDNHSIEASNSMDKGDQS